MNFKLSMRAERFTLLFAFLLVLFYNSALLDYILEYRQAVTGSMRPADWLFMGSALVLFTGFLTFFFALFSVPYLQKSLAIVLVLSAASASFFMRNYGVMFDKHMIQNMLGTDLTEAKELISLPYMVNFILLGLIPALLIARIKLQYDGVLMQGFRNIALALFGAMLMVVVAVPYYADYSSMFRNKREMQYMVNPMSFVVYGIRHFTQSAKAKDLPVIRISEGAHRKPRVSVPAFTQTAASDPSQANVQSHAKQVMIMVLGETARAQNFSIDGYQRVTTPRMEALQQNDSGFVNFSQVSSCGTATAVSLPCLFSKFPRTNYDDEKGIRYESLLDVMATAGMSVYWRDNNTGCKGVCDRVSYESVANAKVPDFCQGDGDCYDEVLLHGIEQMIDQQAGDVLIVLHQNGSHGPTYYARVPPALKVFAPACETSQLNECENEAIVNAYDNTIYYTDYFLNKVVDLLKRRSELSTAMFYVSDHGESLGENNLYLHGAPYFMAPKEQIHVPMMMWLSQRFQQDQSIDMACVKQRSGAELSHDYVFHSLLGLLGIESSAYQSGLDFTAECRGEHGSVVASRD